MNIDYNFITEKISTVFWHSAILLSCVGVLKLYIAKYFLWKITESQKSKINISDAGHIAEFHHSDGSHAMTIFKNLSSPKKSEDDYREAS